MERDHKTPKQIQLPSLDKDAGQDCATFPALRPGLPSHLNASLPGSQFFNELQEATVGPKRF